MKRFIVRTVDILFPPSERLMRIRTGIANESFSTMEPFDRSGVTILFPYKTALIEDIVIESKTTGNREAITVLAQQLSDYIMELVAEETVFNGNKVIITCVPTHSKKVRSRGFNHLKDVLNTMNVSGIDIKPEALTALRITEDQVGKTKTERELNIKDAFKADEKVVRDAVVIVIDDVTTTGATLVEATRALRQSGARKVIPLAFAG